LGKLPVVARLGLRRTTPRPEVREATMSHRVDNARQWRARAEEARDLSEQLANSEGKRIMLCIAVSYVALAQLAEERDATRHKRRG
jgi:regulator of protease activity HflC (stomatin/prohibitin superfamily)